MTDSETDLEAVVESMEEIEKSVSAIQRTLARQELAREKVEFPEIPTPIVNVAPAVVNVPAPIVHVMPADAAIVEPRPKRFLSTVKRDNYGMITSIETTVIV